MRLTINLATRIYINTRRLNIFIAVALTLLTLFLLFNAREIATSYGEKRRLAKGIAVLEGKAKGAKGGAVPEKEYQALLAGIKFANVIIEQKTFDWLMLFEKLENVVPDGVTLVSIEPSPKEGGLKLAGIAKNFGNLRKFMENLEDSGYFTEINLVSQSNTQVSESRKVISFNITCKAKYT
ncbi:MAG: PilN domain-containing protein [Geobacteraceae bacterium]|jgi:type IV pilus assembly protein PilN